MVIAGKLVLKIVVSDLKSGGQINMTSRLVHYFAGRWSGNFQRLFEERHSCKAFSREHIRVIAPVGRLEPLPPLY